MKYPNELLEEAILNSDIEGIDRALDKGADVNATMEYFEIKGPHYLVMSYPLWIALKEGVKDLEGIVAHLLAKGAKPSNYKTPGLASKGSTLVMACQLGGKLRYKIVQMLLEHGANPQEGKGAVYASIPWGFGTKEENLKLRELLDSYSIKKVPNKVHHQEII